MLSQHNVFIAIDGALTVEIGREKLRVESWGSNSIRVRATLESEFDEDKAGALISQPELVANVKIDYDHAEVVNGRLRARIRLQDNAFNPKAKWLIEFFDESTGHELIAENPHPFVRRVNRYFKPTQGGLHGVEARFKSYDDERIYGLGQHQHGFLDQKGCVIELIQRNTEVSIPFLYSNRGYGFLWNNPAVGRVELGKEATLWVAESAKELDYWVTAGSPAEVMTQYADATGHAPAFPEWAAGFWQSKLRYRSQEELLTVAREYRNRGLPLSVIVADFFHWTLMGEWRFDPVNWPDPGGMVRELESYGVKLVVSIWPTVNPIAECFEEMEERGFLIGTERGVTAHTTFIDNRPDGPVSVHYYDSTNSKAREYIWRRVRDGYYKYGVRAWWLDACEPEMYPMDHDNLRLSAGNGLEIGNIYPLMHAKAFYDGMRSEGETEVLSLCRSAWAGSQRYGAAVWSGDIASTFETLRIQVKAGLNMAMSGIPWWTTDIGGFHGGDPESPAFRELVVRWFQFGVFCPIFRLHGHRAPTIGVTGGSNEVWSFGEEAYGIIIKILQMRERMKPYIMEQMASAVKRGEPLMRPLFYGFPGDENVYCVEDEFLFGPDVLVAPVLHEGARRRMIYLPKGVSWVDCWTEEEHVGGKTIDVDAPLSKIPFFRRKGSNVKWI